VSTTKKIVVVVVLGGGGGGGGGVHVLFLVLIPNLVLVLVHLPIKYYVR
jgi:hypothetical protein